MKSRRVSLGAVVGSVVGAPVNRRDQTSAESRLATSVMLTFWGPRPSATILVKESCAKRPQYSHTSHQRWGHTAEWDGGKGSFMEGGYGGLHIVDRRCIRFVRMDPQSREGWSGKKVIHPKHQA